ncbi:MAG: MG2 domain-containing protein, partial [Ginsengibacter sp.]
MNMPQLSKLTLLLYFFCFASSNLMAQKNMDDYTAQWKKVEEFQKKGLPKSALQEVENIYFLAKKTDNNTQIIKSLLFKINLQQNIQEDASVKSIDSLEKESTVAKGSAKSILQSITAQLYWQYFQQNRYKLYQRTNTENFDKKDIATWTIDDLHSKIGQLYLASLQNEEELKQTPLAPFDAIIAKGNVRNLRPTLFDLLSHRALDYFKNDERNISRPSYAFEINDKAAFAPISEFINHSFSTKDSSSLHHKALIIFQKLLAFHQNDTTKDALIDADIERLQFVYQYATITDKDKLYLLALKSIAKNYKDNPASAQASFLIAQSIYNFATGENQHKDSLTYTVINAKEMLDIIIKNYPESEGGINAKNLLKQLLHPEIFLTTEKINVPGSPFRTLVKYKNFNQVYLRLIPLTAKLKTYLKTDSDNKSVFSKLIAQDNVRSWEQDLPVTNDYLSHSVEIKIDALPPGEYALLSSADKNFSLDKNPLAAQYFHVSDISFVNSGYKYFALNRTTGQPLYGAKIQVWQSKYDYSRRDYPLIKQELLFADKNGFFELSDPSTDKDPKAGNSRNVLLEITYKNDKLFLDDYQYTYYNFYNDDSESKFYTNQMESDAKNTKIFLFTDRSIYRPGQLVYFKGIGVTKDWKTKKSILLQSKDSLNVILNDANGEKIDSIKVVLNEFGSFNGKFKLPENKMNGEFDMVVSEYDNSPISFSVEEYKRPKFYTDFEKAKDSYRVGDTVSITGFAKAYAGNNIDGAAVTYRVTRVARFIYPWRFWGRGLPNVQPMEIAHGEAITDADGKFIVKFAAIPDLSLDKNTDPVFDYEVEADVTDLNGETRSGKITVPVGYKALNLQINLRNEDLINIDSFKTISISSKNLSGEVNPVKTDVKIYKLQPPQRLIRQRLWTQPDQFIFDKNEYIQYFPHDEYKDETNKETWPKEGLIYSKSDSASLNSAFDVSSSKFVQGWYVVEATAKDKYGQEVKDIKYFQLFDKNSSSLPSPQYAWNVEEKVVVEPGETAKIITGSSAKDVYLIQEIRTSREPMTMHLKTGGSRKISPDTLNFIRLNNKKSFDFKITEADRGGFGVNEFFVKDNRFYTITNNIYVPWSNKELDISFDTYRDKVLPGSEEKWTVKIAGYKGQKVAAEMLASMYDASLDQFKLQSW